MPPPPPSGRKSCHVTVVGRSGLQANWPTTVEHEFARGKHAFLYGRAGTSEHATVTAVGHFYIASGSGKHSGEMVLRFKYIRIRVFRV